MGCVCDHYLLSKIKLLDWKGCRGAPWLVSGTGSGSVLRPLDPRAGRIPSEATGLVRGVVRPEGPWSQLSCWGSGCTGLQANPQPTSLHMKPPPSLPSPALAHPSEMNLILASCHKKSQSKPAITHCQIPGGCSNQTQHGVGMGLLGPCPLRLKFAALCSMYSPATLQIPVDAAL